MATVKIAIITGASNGIGRAISARLADDRFFVIAADIDRINGKALTKELGADRARFIYCDIRSEDAVRRLFKEAMSRFGRVDAVINNAGIIKDAMIHNMKLADYEKVLDVNLKGTWLMCREAAKIMRKQRSGRIINISSRAWLGNAGQSNYSASKAGVVGLTRVLALELGKYNVLVNAVAPGMIDTPLTRGLPAEVFNTLIKNQPTKSMGTPEDVANAVSFLASDRTQFITGQTIYVDGGKSIGGGV